VPSDQRQPDRLPSYDESISRLLFAICLIIPVTLILAVIFYRDSFHLLGNAFSELGEIRTHSGNPNPVARLIFSAGFIASGAAMLVVSWRFARTQGLRNRFLKSALALFATAGFFIGITPNDLSHFWHSVGMGTVVGSIFFLGLIFLLEIKPTISTFVFWWNLSVLSASVLLYATLWFLDSDLKQMAQKACVIGLLLVMERAGTLAPEGFEWRTALGTLRKNN